MRRRNWLFASAMLLTVLMTGCSKSAKTASKNETADNNDPIRVWTLSATPSTSVKSWKESPFHTGLEKASRITVDWQFPPEGSDQTQAFNLMIAENDFPEIMSFG